MSDWEVFCQVLFELSNENRLAMLMNLVESPQTVTELAKELNTSTQETSEPTAITSTSKFHSA